MERSIDIRIVCKWDPEAQVWWAESEDLPGLVTEAGNIPDLIQRVMEVAPELIQDNLLDGKEGDAFLLNLLPVYQQTVHITAH